MALSSPGIGSGLDVNGIVSQLMAVERQPLQKLDLKEATFQAKLSAYGSLKGSLSSFQSAVSGLSSASKFQSLKATPSDSTIATASASSIAAAGSYSIEVLKLAQSHKIATAGYATVDSVVGTGTLTIQFGTDNGAGGFAVNPDKATQTVVIDSTNSTLSGVRDKINSSNIGVKATIVNDGINGNKLVLTSADSGAANSLSITNAGGGLAALVYDPTATKTMTQTQVAQNASATVDGITISKASNTITDAIQGVTINLLKLTNAGASGSPISINVARDSAGIGSAVDTFVKAYNDVNKTVAGLTAYDAKTKRGGPLLGDASVSSTLSRIRSLVTAPIKGLSGAYSSLADIGVSFQRDGSLTVNSTKLSAAVNGNADDIAGLFAAVGKTSDSQVKFVSATSGTVAGAYPVYVTSLATQGNYLGAGVLPAGFATPVVIGATNNTLAIRVDGVQSGTVTLTSASYATGAALAAEIQSKINGDTNLLSSGKTVSVAYDSANNRLVTTSASYGPASEAAFTSWGTTTQATLGLAVPFSTSLGSNLVGTINDASATGTGQHLTAAGGGADGIDLLVTGGAVASSRGTVNYSRGYASQLDQLVGSFLSSSGVVASTTDGINQSIKDIGSQRNAINLRLTTIEARYRKQFTALDVAISNMTKTSNFLTQQLAVLSKTTA
jgi:flagellar hook-associated protein 2